MDEKTELIQGSKIIGLETHGSKFDGGHLINVILDTGELCRMDVGELLKTVNHLTFRATMKRRYRHLTVEG